MNVNGKVHKSNLGMNQKLLSILTRSDFDRPILMHDKLDFIWDKDDDDMDKIVD